MNENPISNQLFPEMPSQGRRTSMPTLDNRRLSVAVLISEAKRKTSNRYDRMRSSGSLFVEEDEFASASRRGSTASRVSFDQIRIQETKIDKEIKKQIGHHSPDVESTADITEDANDVTETSQSEKRSGGGGIFRKFFWHLHLAFATPSLIRIPHLAHKYSTKNGSAFLMVYVLCLIFVAIPIAVLEVTMAQYSSVGPVSLFSNCLPILKGLGFGMVLTYLVLMVYTSVLLSWTTFYLVESMQAKLPWATCPTNQTNGCEEVVEGLPTTPNETQKQLFNNALIQPNILIRTNYIPSDYHYQMNVVQTLDIELDNGLEVNTGLLGCLLGLWVLLLLAMSLNIHQVWVVKKLEWLASLFSLVMILVLMFQGITLEGSGRGLEQVFDINFDNVVIDLCHPDLWDDCIGQVFWSLGPVIGLLLSRSSYNVFKNKLYVEVMTASLVNFSLVVLAMLAIFPYAGHIYRSHDVYKNVGYFFVMSSYAVTKFKASHVLSVLFYLSVAKGLFSHMLMLLDTITVSLSDTLTVKWREGYRRFLLNSVVCTVAALSGIIFVTKEGLFYLSAVDMIFPWLVGIILGFIEVSCLAYIYGASKIGDHSLKMVRHHTVFVYVWKFFTPPVLLGFLIWSTKSLDNHLKLLFWDHSPTERERCYWVVAVIITAAPIGLPFLVLLIQIFTNYKNLKSLFQPTSDWGPALTRHEKFYSKDQRYIKSHIPWLAVQVNQDFDIPTNDPKWIPFGFSWIPEGESALHNKESSSDICPQTRSQLAAALQQRFRGGDRRTGSKQRPVEAINQIKSMPDQSSKPSKRWGVEAYITPPDIIITEESDVQSTTTSSSTSDELTMKVGNLKELIHEHTNHNIEKIVRRK